MLTIVLFQEISLKISRKTIYADPSLDYFTKISYVKNNISL